MTTWLVRGSGANTNGGTSATVRSTGSDGVANTTAGLTLFSSISATWGAGDVGHAIYASGGTITRLISAVQAQQTVATVVTTNSSTTVASVALFTAGMVGCAISGPGIAAGAVVTVFTSSSAITISIAAGAGFGTGSAVIGAKLTTTGTTNFTTGAGQTWNVGGALLTVNRALVTASGAINCMAAGDLVYLGAGTYRETTAVGISGAATASGTNGVTSNGGTTFTDSTANAFTSGMVGQYIEITAGGSTYGCKITAYTSTSVVTIAPATATGFPTAAFSSCTWNVGKIAVIGDVDGAQTGDAGQVTVSAYTTNDKSAPSSTVLLSLTTLNYLAFSLITFIGGAARICQNLAGGGIGCTFTDCLFNAVYPSGAVMINLVSSTTGLAMSMTWDRCTFVTYDQTMVSISLTTTASGAADWDALVVIRNCLLLGTGSGADGVAVTATLSNAHHGGGIRIYDSTIFASIAFYTSSANVSTTVPCEIHNSIMIGASVLQASTAGQITGSYNCFYAANPETNYTYGTGDVSNSAGTGTYLAPLLELGQAWKWAGVVRPFMAPDGATSPLLGAGSATFSGNYPNFDWQGRSRPSGGGSANAAIGYLEFHDGAAQDTVVYPTSYTSSGKLTGPADQDLWVPVDAVSTTIAIQLYQGAGYTGTNYATATILPNGELGIAAQVQTCSSSTGSWQTLTFSAVTASKAGWVKVRVSSYDTSGTGTLNFGALTAS